MFDRRVICLALVATTIGCTAVRSRPGEVLEREHEKGGERRKHWSGTSYEAQTRIDAHPSASLVASGFDSERVWSGHDDWEPAIAVDPSSSYVYQAVTRYGMATCARCADAIIAFRRSPDGGTTWEPDQVLYESKLGQFDPLLEVSGNGTLFAAFMLSYTPGVMVTRSLDHGTTWSKPVAVGNKLRNPWSDKPVMTVSRDGKDVYVAFNTSDAYVVASHDGGVTFLQPVKVNRDTRYWYAYQGAVAPDGAVYFAELDVSQDFTGEQHINVLRSTSGGRTWTITRLDTSAQSPECSWIPGCYLGFFAGTTSLAVDVNGTVMSAYSASSTDGGPAQLYFRTSPDGVNWNARQPAAANVPTVYYSFPTLAAGPAPGDFRLSWQDDRNGSAAAWNTWYRATADGGSSWSQEVLLSDQVSGAPYKSAAGYAFPYGDYYELAVDSSGVTHILWGEGSSWDGPGGTWYTRGR